MNLIGRDLGCLIAPLHASIPVLQMLPSTRPGIRGAYAGAHSHPILHGGCLTELPDGAA
ncbi:hypothetical protein [Deinococcus sp.]|uniref:hypothetical protein n=1 Tax=Deinococcus sp. TaxID=47478 RepID=UPI0025BAFAB3|nr:hypothetical protein [Deinococcus sp.]